MLKHRLCLLITVFLMLGSALAACDGGDKTEDTTPTTVAGEPRSFAMGLSSLPPKLTEESYAATFERAASAGEVILIQRIPPWEDLLKGDAFPSDEVAQQTQRETELAKENGLDVFVAIDPTGLGGDEDELAGLPEELRGADFSQDEIRDAFVLYAQYVALNYEPRYLALGVEVNTHQEQDPDGFTHFVSAYAEAYDAVKELSPETLVFPTFQLEELQGLLPPGTTQKTQWHYLDRFEPRMDLLAVSSYPGLVYSEPSEIPKDYFSQIESHTSLPIAFVEVGYSSDDGGTDTDTEGGGEDAQADFLERVINDAEDLEAPLLVWFVGQDPEFTGDPPLDMLGRIGLVRTDGTEKKAWLVWSEAAARPLAQPPATGPSEG